MGWLAALAVAVAVSVDGSVAGAAYGLRRIRVPAASLAIIGAVSGLLVAAAMAGGGRLAGMLGSAAAARLGAGLFLALGLGLTWRAWRSDGRGPSGALPAAPSPEAPLVLVRVRPLGLIVQIWRDPPAADIDRSGRLEGLEAAALGFILALDAVAAGLGMALNGGGFLFAALVGPVQVAFVSLGARLGARAAGEVRSRVMDFAPGGILLVVGLLRLI